MKPKDTIRFMVGVISMIAVLLLAPSYTRAHCDTMNGPVVKAAQQALEKGNVNLVLIWVQPNDEKKVREAFAKTLVVRKLSPEARQLADMYFFETLVRIHRAGEGVAYTGLKPAETEVEHGILAAENALETGTTEELVTHLSEALRGGVQRQFAGVMSKRKYDTNDVNAGREYVKAYVEFIHYTEGVFNTLSGKENGHARESEHK